MTNIQRLRYSTLAHMPIGDENEFFALGYICVRLIPDDDTSDLLGNTLTAWVQKKPEPVRPVHRMEG